MGYQNNPRIVTDGLVLCLDANDVKSYPGTGTIWYDLSGNNYDLTLQNSPTYVSDKGGFLLDGVDDYINGGISPLDFTGTYTFEVWMKFNAGDSIGGGAHIIGSNGRGDGLLRGADGNNTHLTIDGSGNLKVFTFNGGGSTDYDTGFNVSVGETCHVGFSHFSGAYKLGIKNGIQSASESTWSTQDFNYLIIGGEHNEAGYFTQMNYPNITIYNVKCYTRILSAKEVLQNFNAHKSRFGL